MYKLPEDVLWSFVVIAIAAPFLLFSFYRVMTTTSYKTYFINFVFLMILAPVISTALWNNSWFISPEEIKMIQKLSEQQPSTYELLGKIPIPLICSFIFWGLGMHFVWMKQLRKAGHSWWRVLFPLMSDRKYLDGKSRAIMFLLTALVFIVFFLTVEPAPR